MPIETLERGAAMYAAKLSAARFIRGHPALFDALPGILFDFALADRLRRRVRGLQLQDPAPRPRPPSKRIPGAATPGPCSSTRAVDVDGRSWAAHPFPSMHPAGGSPALDARAGRYIRRFRGYRSVHAKRGRYGDTGNNNPRGGYA